ncbi:NAD-dependent epimerase/dehydratase family protein [Chloroflexota bacterium]
MNYADELGNCFVTGAAGFIGSHLVERLLKEGCQVMGYDNCSSGHEKWLEPYMTSPLFTFVKGDLLDYDILCKSMEGHNTVFHLAANGDIRAAIENPRLDLEQGVIATFNVIESMRQCRVSWLFFASSGSVFGMTDQIPTPETVGPLFPISMYAGSKMACEGLVSAAAHTFGFKARIYRLGNVVGERMSRGVIFDFITKLTTNPCELEILGDGNQEKNYIVADDVVDGMLFTYANDSESVCDLFHLGGADSLKVIDLAKIIIEEMALENVNIRYTGGTGGWQGDQTKAIFNITKLNKIGWFPHYSSAEAVRITARKLKKQIKETYREAY